MKIILIGRPSSQIADKGTYVALVMQSQKTPALPKGRPTPSADIKTNYVVYIAAKQWRKVADCLADLQDALIIEGFPQIKLGNGSIAVFATNVTTKKLQQARKDQQRQEND